MSKASKRKVQEIARSQTDAPIPQKLAALPGLLIFLISLPLLARLPISGDGAEFVVVAEQGGVLHPPGFPLQAWLNRLWIHLPFWNLLPTLATPTWRLSLLSLLGHCGAVFLVADTLRLLRTPLLWIWLGAIAVGALPALLHTGVQPEVFSWAHFWMTAAFHQAVRIQTRERSEIRLRDVAEVAVFGALCLAQHPITVVAAPIFLCSSWMLWKRIAAPRRKLLLGSGISFFLLTLGLSYLSLPLLRTTSPWPDWGALQTVGDILRHFTREEFGIFSLSPNAADTGNSALKILVQEVFTHWNVALLALLPGFGLVFSFSEPFFAGLVGCLGAAFLFLLRAESFGTDAYNITLLERFIGTGAIPLALVLGLAGRKVDPRWRRAALIGIVAIFGAAFLNRSRIDASSELTMQSYREAIAQDLPENALYISGQNEEYFAGIPTEKGLRFPIQKGGFLNRRWYVESTLPRLEPALPHTFGITHRELVEAALAAGRPVVSPDEDVFRSLKLPAEMRGILWYAPAQPDMLQTEKTLESALRLCTLVQRMKQLPEKGHGYAHQLRKYFARAYSHAGLYLQKRGNTAGAQAAHSLMVALLNPHYPQPFEQLCDQLRSAAR